MRIEQEDPLENAIPKRKPAPPKINKKPANRATSEGGFEDSKVGANSNSRQEEEYEVRE